jgi:thiamin-phosphate kinase
MIRLDYSLYVIVGSDTARGRPLADIVRAVVRGGATVIQLREKEGPAGPPLLTRDLIAVAQELRALTRQLGVPFIIDDRVDVALAVDADGVHVGQDDMPAALARRLIGPGKVLGVSAGTAEEAMRAERDGADYLGVGSVFATVTKPDAGAPIGVEGLSKIVRAVKIPVVGIGGITAENAAAVIRAGAAGVAVISAVVGADNVESATRQLLLSAVSGRPSAVSIRDLGEFGLIARIRQMLPAASNAVLVAIGDDVALLRLGIGANGRSPLLLATCDVQVEGAHFLRDKIAPRDLGRKALAINLSDIGAKGGLPRFALVSLGLPPDLDIAFVDALYAGLQEEARRFDVAIVGGNLARASQMFIDVTLLGEIEPDTFVPRSGACVGDVIAVTGQLGDAAASVALLLDESLAREDAYACLALARAWTPTPRVREGRVIALTHAATAMIDVSDGFAADLGHIADESGVGVRVYAERLPVAHENRALAERCSCHPSRGTPRNTVQDASVREWHFALYGGEDYELIFTAPAAHAEDIARRVEQETGTRVSFVGEIVPAEAGRVLVINGQTVPLEAGGWDHYRGGH